MRTSRSGRTARYAAAAMVLVLVLAGAFVLYARIHDWNTRSALLTLNPDLVPVRPELARYAVSLGEPAYAANCTSCHGADLSGDKRRGAPNLGDSIWLYGTGRVAEIERTILYGIRSGHPKAHRVTDMPALGAIKQLTPEDVHDAVAYVLALQKRPADPAAVARGKMIWDDKGVCYDCHSPSGIGNPDYGSPNLTDADSMWGNEPETLYRSIYDGRHGLCPAFFGKLDFATIRGIAVYLYEKTHAQTGAAAVPNGRAPG